MTASDASFIGFAKQSAKGSLGTAFQYILFTRGSAGVQNNVVPLDQEVGGGSVVRDVVKAGYTAGGAFEFIPRPDSLGMFLMGMTGSDGQTGGTALLGYDHVFKLTANSFDAPYYTVNYAPGNMWGEQYQDCRFSSVGLSWRAANFVRGQLGFVGRLGTPNVDMATWSPTTKVDGTPPLITPTATMQVPSGTNVKVLAGSFQATSAIPLDQQWIVGSANVDDLDIVQRAFVLNLTLKVTDATLYNKMTYDGVSASVTAWAADAYRPTDFNITFKTAQDIPSTSPAKKYTLSIAGNGAGNVVWSASPLGLRSGQQVIMNVTGVFLADPSSIANTLTLHLINKTSTNY